MTTWQRIFRTLALVTASSPPGHEATSLPNRIWEYSDVLHCRRSQTLHSLTGAVGGHFQVSVEMWERVQVSALAGSTKDFHRVVPERLCHCIDGRCRSAQSAGLLAPSQGFTRCFASFSFPPDPSAPSCWKTPHGMRLPPWRCTSGAEQVTSQRWSRDEGRCQRSCVRS